MKVIFNSSLISLLLLVVAGNPESSKTNNIPPTDGKIQVTYSVRVQANKQISTMKLNVAPQTSFLDIMVIAERQDYYNFRFTNETFKKTPGVFITSIGGIPEHIPKPGDKSNDHFWMLYNCNKQVDPAQYDTLEGCTLSKTGVSITKPKNGDNWLFNYQYYNWNENQHKY